MNTVNLSRRKFLKTTGLVGGGLIVGFALPGCSPAKLPVDTIAGSFIPNAFIQITPDNAIRFYCPRAEMGQGVTTGLGTLVAEELDVAPQALEIALAGAHKDYNNPDLGMQVTGGSTSVHAHYLPLRQAAANTRSVLVEAAARDLGVARDTITTDTAHIISGGQRYPYGQFVATAAKMKMPEKAPLKSDTDFKYIGKSFPRLDGVAKSTGTATYAIDVDL
ncbi:MAG TPA: molybdopterin cofactor-binding domain-containing protein, partial [Pseudomonadales bacterium]|nr:molybdopterin cofactor-binding domain-containing protein [Pseudomonadales bacterium]